MRFSGHTMEPYPGEGHKLDLARGSPVRVNTTMAIVKLRSSAIALINVTGTGSPLNSPLPGVDPGPFYNNVNHGVRHLSQTYDRPSTLFDAAHGEDGREFPRGPPCEPRPSSSPYLDYCQ